MSQQETTVVHCQRDPYDVYIGRRADRYYHFGNPFSHHANTLASVRVVSRREAVEAFRDWLSGVRYQDIEPERRRWILANLKTLKGKRIACWCKPLDCHGDVLKELADACD